jgi:excisionase family DNA binding protein
MPYAVAVEAPTILKLNQQTVRNWIDSDKLPAVHVGRRVRIKRSDFDRLLEQGNTAARNRPYPEGGITAHAFSDGAEVPTP